MASERIEGLGQRLGKVAPFGGVVTAAAVVGIVAAVKEERAALWLERFHQVSAFAYVVLFAFVVLGATLVATTDRAGSEPLRGALRAALGWGWLATFYGVLVAALDLPSGEGSVFAFGALSAYIGTGVALVFAALAAELSRALRA